MLHWAVVRQIRVTSHSPSGLSMIPQGGSSCEPSMATTLNRRQRKRPEIQDDFDSKERLEVQVEELKEESKPPVFFLRRRFLFPLGLFFGILMGFAFVEPQNIQNLQFHMAALAEQYSINMPDLSRVEAEWTRLRNNIPEVWKFNNDGREFKVGEAMKARGLTAKHPVILIPGIVSTSLESWSTVPAYRPFFREKLWGGFNMLSQVMFNKEKWISAMMLDPETGLDPPEVKIRAAEGLDAASALLQGYWIWSKIIENLAVVNYDTNNLYLAPYDWRLSLYNLEERDGYFSKLKYTIEGLRMRYKQKVVIAAHSMGCTVLLLVFVGVEPLMSEAVVTYATSFKWAESPDYGNGGADWVENHIEGFISIAGTHLGVAKVMSAFLSGEMKDTVQLHPAGAYVLEQFFSRKERQKLFRSWAGSASLWMKGGNAVWGNATHAPDDSCENHHSHGDLIAFREPPSSLDGTMANMTAEEASQWILEHTPSAFQKMLVANYSYGIERDEEQIRRNDGDFRKWSNPLEVALPYAPSMKIYCVYGHGKETERSYWYMRGNLEHDISQESQNTSCIELDNGACDKAPPRLEVPLPRTSWIDAAYTDESLSPKVKNGVKMGEGDGTVSLLSLGAMCVEGWKRKRWNPAGILVTTIELPHKPLASIPRGGANTSDHVDILGSTGLNEIILKVATGVGHEIGDEVVSKIQEYARKIEWD